MNDILKQIEIHKIVPVIKLEDCKNALPLGKALIEGGLPVAEVTFRTDAAEESIRILTKAYPKMNVGAGTVISVEQAKRAVDAGATYIVMPGINTKVIEYCLNENVPVLPGICTPSEIMVLLDYGINIVKFFPAEAYGGLETIKALSAPFPLIKFIPTGGINVNNILKYLKYEKIVACGGSWMVPNSDIKTGNFVKIKDLVNQAVNLVKEG